MSKRPPLSRKWSKGQLQRRGSWRRFVLHPPMSNMMSARLLQPHKVVPTDPLIARGTLPNGLQYYVAPNAVPREHVIMRLVLRVGALQGAAAWCAVCRCARLLVGVTCIGWVWLVCRGGSRVRLGAVRGANVHPWH